LLNIYKSFRFVQKIGHKVKILSYYYHPITKFGVEIKMTKGINEIRKEKFAGKHIKFMDKYFGADKYSGTLIVASLLVAATGVIGYEMVRKYREQKEKLQKKFYSQVQLPYQYQKKLITGEIINIDEDAFAISSLKHNHSGGGAGIGSFYYEILRIKDKEENIKKILSPLPTSYNKGDYISIKYIPHDRISLEQLLHSYGKTSTALYGICNDYEETLFSIQRGILEIDGIIYPPLPSN